MSDAQFAIRPLIREDREWVARFLDEHWFTTQIVTRGRILYGHLLPGFVAERPLPPDEEDQAQDPDATEINPIVRMEKVGLITYNLEEKSCEIVTVDSILKDAGVGSALIKAVKQKMKEEGAKRIWLITTNDNVEALKFYQKHDFELVAVHRNAIEQARRLKPQIPIVGKHGIPIRDEIELELPL